MVCENDAERREYVAWVGAAEADGQDSMRVKFPGGRQLPGLDNSARSSADLKVNKRRLDNNLKDAVRTTRG